MTRSSGLLAAALVAVCALHPARAEEPMDAASLAHALDRLGSTGRVLYVAAHPDDENTRLLAYLANDRHVTAGYLAMTRGGGGQNLIGTEQGELLDTIRTEELLAARGLDGAVQRFSRMRDFGYSKTADETFRFWGHDEALADVVWVIRTFQPDVIITRFDELPPNHGHHTASAILAREAFAAAADPTKFPEQLVNGVTAWQADRLLHNVSPWKEGPPPAGTFAMDVGGYDPRRGLEWGELAALSRSQHKSQGFGVPGERGALPEKFLSLAGTKPKADILEGLNFSWGRLGEKGAAYQQAIDDARAKLDRDQPQKAIPALLRAHVALDGLPDSMRVRAARLQLEKVIVGASELFIRATAPQPIAVPGAKVKVDVEVVERRPAGVLLRSVAVGDGRTDVNAKLEPLEKKVVSREVTIPEETPVSTPYWLAEPPQTGHFVVSDRSLVGEPRTPPAMVAKVALTVDNVSFELPVPVVHSWTDHVHGERIRPFMIVPPATVTPARQAVLLPNGKPAAVVLRVRAGRDALKGDVRLPLPAGWKVTPATQAVELAKQGDEATVRFEVSAPANTAALAIRPEIEVNGKKWSFREDVIDYPHIPLQLVLQPSSLKLVPLALKLPSGLVGYVPGSGDTVAEDLAHVGMRVETIDEETLRSGDLSRFAAIVVGIRAWNTRPVLKTAHPRLMAFVEKGGTLVVQYNTNNRIAPLESPIGPFPLEIGRDRITDETAAMTPVDPKHPALHVPNELTPADFEGWVQERGIYYASKWDPKYQPLFSSQDPGEAPLLGGTLVAKHGKGRYVYTGLVFFRQLPAGVPGAYRLFANLLAK